MQVFSVRDCALSQGNRLDAPVKGYLRGTGTSSRVTGFLPWATDRYFTMLRNLIVIIYNNHAGQSNRQMKSFSYFEQSIERASQLVEGMPLQQVVLNRLMLHVFRELQERQNRFLMEFGLNGSSFLALAMILSADGGCLNPCDLSDGLMASRANVTRVVDQLVAAGWVERNTSDDDRRRIVLSVTPSGRDLLETILPRLWQGTETLWSLFSQQEQAQMNRLLRKLLVKLEEGNDANAA